MGYRQSRAPDHQREGPQWHRALVDAGGRAAVARRLPTLVAGDHRVRAPYGNATGEILTLQWSQVDLARRTLTTLERKNGARDTLPVNDTAMEVLQARAAMRTNSTAVFVNGAGHPRETRNLLRRSIPRCERRGSCGSGLMTSVTPLHPAHPSGRRCLYGPEVGPLENDLDGPADANHQPESLRGGAEVLDRLRRENSTKLAQLSAASTGGIA
jgi:hypothetical protein